MELRIETNGNLRTIYIEALNLAEIGSLAIRRASHVEPTPDGGWTADLSPVGGPILGPFNCRSEALQAEVAWLRTHWLNA